MQLNTDELSVLAEMLGTQRTASLEKELAEARQESAYWRRRCEMAETISVASEMENMYLKNYIMLSAEKMRSFVQNLGSVERWAFLRSFVQWSLPEELQAKEMPMIDEAMPMPQPPSLTMTAEGDVRVEGNWNDVHDNGTVRV